MPNAIDGQIRKLLNFFILLFLIISGVLVYWQVGQAQALSNSPYRRCIASEQPVRGNIYDRNGVLLAWSVRDPNSPCGWQRRYATAQHPSISSFLGYFSYLYGETGLEAYYDSVLTGQTAQSPQDAQTQTLNNALHRETYGANIYLSIDIRIQDEVDKVFFDQVKGGVCTNGSPHGSIIVEDPRNGQILALDSRPYFNGDTLGDFNNAADGATNPDGSVKTVSQEYFDTIRNDPNSPLFNRALQGQYPPGSAFKTMTLIAAVNSGQFNIHSTFTQSEAQQYTVNGFLINSNNLGDYTHGPQPATFPLELGHAYAYSDNVVFARVGDTLGATWLDYARQFQMSTPDNLQAINIDTDPNQVASSLIYRTADQNPATNPVALAVSAFGQGQLFLSPLTMEMIDSAVAADGNLYAPRFLLKVVPNGTNAGDVANNAPVLISQPFSPPSAQQVRQAMRDVVTYGSVGASGGSIAAIGNLNGQDGQPLAIGGKTGTAQSDQANPHAWFVSLAPDDQGGGQGPAKLAITIMKEYGGEGACQAPIAGELYQFALPLVAAQP